MLTLTYLVAEMRELGIKSLALELESPSESPPMQAQAADSAPDTDVPPPEPKDPTLCVATGCGEKAGGIFGGVAAQYCRAHAFQAAGVKA